MLLCRTRLLRGVGWESRYRTLSELRRANPNATESQIRVKVEKETQTRKIDEGTLLKQQLEKALDVDTLQRRKREEDRFKQRLEFFEEKYPGILGLGRLPEGTKLSNNSGLDIVNPLPNKPISGGSMGASQSMRAAHASAPTAVNGRAFKIGGAEFHLGKALKGEEEIMSKKAGGFGTCLMKPADKLRFGCDSGEAGNVGCFNRHYAERSGYATRLGFYTSNTASEKDPMIFYDVCTNKPLFVAPQGRSWEAFVRESENHGWPSFRNEEVVQENVRTLPDGESVSVDGTHLGHNIPDAKGDRYCINLVSIAGNGVSKM